MTDWGCIDTAPSKGQGSYVWIFPVPPASWGFGAGGASGSQGMSASSEHEGSANLGLALSPDPMVLPWSLTQSPHLALGLASLASSLEMGPEPLRHTVRFAFPPNTYDESLFQRARGRKGGPGSYTRTFEQKWSWHWCL